MKSKFNVVSLSPKILQLILFTQQCFLNRTTNGESGMKAWDVEPGQNLKHKTLINELVDQVNAGEISEDEMRSM